MIPAFAQQLRDAAKLAGETSYESMLICPRCRTYLRYVKNNVCVVCQRARGYSRKVKPAMDFPQLARTRDEALARGDALWWPDARCQHFHWAPRFTDSNKCQTCVEWGVLPR